MDFGRLAKSNLPYSVIYPYFIPKEHYFATLIVLKSHDDIKHEARDTISNLREEFWISKSRNFVKGIINKFWISKSRNFVKGIINKCSLCRKFEGPCCDYPNLDRYQILELISIFYIRLLVLIMQVQSMLETFIIPKI